MLTTPPRLPHIHIVEYMRAQTEIFSHVGAYHFTYDTGIFAQDILFSEGQSLISI